MDARVKSGDSLKCDYTGNDDCGAVVKIYGANDVETGWMSAEVLEHGLKMLQSVQSKNYRASQLEGPKILTGQAYQPLTNHSVKPIDAVGEGVSVALSEPVVPIPKETGVPTPGKAPPKDPPQVVKHFEDDLIELKKNPPPKTANSEPDGTIPEFAIKKIIVKHKDYFKNPNQMFTPLRKHVGMNRGRFQMILDGGR